MARSFRQIHFDTLPEAVEEARRLSSLKVTTSGHYAFGQIMEHLARTLDAASGAAPPPAIPWYGKLFGRLVRSKVIHSQPRPGFKLPKQAQAYFWPEDDVTVEAGFQHLERAYNHFMSVQQFPPHPFFGNMSYDDHHQLQCRHFELHLGFVFPN
ncbi:MAG: DUF1569 domain-containing protein [Pirellulaceae bacterium]|nr:DUF1569 domain-containing protein [Pirellulaceae bacterium]